jgi:hypothetical protein
MLAVNETIKKASKNFKTKLKIIIIIKKQKTKLNPEICLSNIIIKKIYVRKYV